MRRYLCPTPHECCTGGNANLGPSALTGHKAHASSEESFKCYGKYLVSMGFTKQGPREFVNPETGAIRLLDKPSRFGVPIRRGKNEKDSGGNRTTPMRSGQAIVILHG